MTRRCLAASGCRAKTAETNVTGLPVSHIYHRPAILPASHVYLCSARTAKSGDLEITHRYPAIEYPITKISFGAGH